MVGTNDRIHSRFASTSARRDHVTRSTRVRQLAAQIAAGEYRVDVEALAEVLVERARLHRRLTVELLRQGSSKAL